MIAPVATYRLQLDPGAGFDDAAGLVDHLAGLGVSHLYLSPIAAAVPGSTHGYDVTDHTSIRDELGGAAAFAALARTAHDAGLGVLIDIVPNHASVAVPSANGRWWSTLREGPRSPDAATFDIDWDSGDGKVLLAVLGRPLAEALDAGDVTVSGGGADAHLDVHGTSLPLAAGTEAVGLPDLLDRQHYRLVWWREPARNVRRFFTIDTLVALRAEDPAVADMVNALPVDLVRAGLVDGLRVDHVDGLADPGTYLGRLASAVPDAWIVVEKILAADEELPATWPVAGTTGYDFVRAVDHLLLDPAGEQALTALWHEVSGDPRPFDDLRAEARAEVLAGPLAPDLDRVAAVAARVVPDLPGREVRHALAALTVGIGRYRTYQPGDPDAAAVVADALERSGHSGDAAAERLVELLGTATTPEAEELQRRWQQLTAPVVAKGDEDRAFYRYPRLASLCEVGGEPGSFGLDAESFHRQVRRTLDRSPATLLAGSTHDTKWSEDVRARLAVLSERPSEWRRLVSHVRSVLDRRRARVHPADAYLALQVVVGAWPIDAARLGAQLVKAAREAELRSSWTDPDESYEQRLHDLAALLTTDDEVVEPIAAFVDAIAPAGWSNALAALVLRMTAPGVPDIYQGCEGWSLSLVDPDNRRRPDWASLRALVEAADRTDAATAWADPADGTVKAAVIRRVLACRRRHPDAFGPQGGYGPIRAVGARADHVVSFDRAREVVVAVTRCSSAVAEGWHDTSLSLPAGEYRDVLVDSGPTRQGSVAVGDLLGRLPVAVLERLG